MMDFDQMMDAWRAQEQRPLYGVNRDLLQVALRHEQANIRRSLRKEQWIAYIAGTALALFAGFWLWVLTYKHEPVLYTLVGAAGVGTFALWAGALWVSRRRQALRERAFGNTLQEEVRRNLSLVEYQLSNGGRWGSALLWSVPPLLGATLLYWLIAGINHKTLSWSDAGFAVVLLGSSLVTAYAGSRAARQKLEPRRARLRELLESLNTGE
jgi:hypothetical protein